MGGAIQSEPSPLDPDKGNAAFRYGVGTAEISRYGSVVDSLLAAPLFDGFWTIPQNVGLFARGLRVGHRPVTVRLFSRHPNAYEVPEGDPITIKLDPAVLLVPVEVATLYSSTDNLGGPTERLDWATEAFDQRTVEVGQVINYNGEHIRTLTNRTTKVTGPEAGWLYRARTGFTPDSIFARCGVQFRLVNYLEEERPGAEVRNESSTTSTTSFCNSANDIVESLGRHMDGVMNVTRLVRPNNQLAADDGSGTSASVCVGRVTSNAATLAHEIGHRAGIGQHCGPISSQCGLMNASPDILASATDCTAVRTLAQTLSDGYATRFPNRWP